MTADSYPAMSAMEPAATLLRRTATELSAEFDASKPVRFSRAPGRLDVMGGIAEYSGSLVAQATISLAAAVVLQERNDRAVQIVSFNQLDAHQPFTLRIPLESLATQRLEKLKQEFGEPGRRWAAGLAGCLFFLHAAGIVDLLDARCCGLNLAILNHVPADVGLGSSAAIVAATMMNLIEHFNVRDRLDPLRMATLCQQVQEGLIGEPRGFASHAASCFGMPEALLPMIAQPHEMQKPLQLPLGIQVIGINSGVKRSSNSAFERTRCASLMAHAIILNQMKQMGQTAKFEMIGDPMRGYLANLDPEDYKRSFREYLPESITGRQFLDRYGPVSSILEASTNFPVQHAADHHVLEARRVRRFLEFVEQASNASGSARKLLLDKAGHLMYASHLSYSNDAMLGTDECDLLVKLVRERESAGFYGARITAGGGGGAVAILAEKSPAVTEAVAQILDIYEKQTGRRPQAMMSSTPGAWHVGASLVKLN